MTPVTIKWDAPVKFKTASGIWAPHNYKPEYLGAVRHLVITALGGLGFHRRDMYALRCPRDRVPRAGQVDAGIAARPIWPAWARSSPT